VEDEVVQLREQVPLAPYTTLGLGGRARYFIECGTEEQVRAALASAAERRLPVYVLGGGSNVVFLDSGFPGLILRITIGGIEFRDGPAPEVRAGAGVDWDTLVQGVVQRGWSGVECLSGIPGTVGGTPIQNVGAYGQEIAETLVSVACLDRTTLERRTFTARDCAFGYRDSRFKRADRGRYVVLEVTLRLARDQRPRIRYPELQRAVADLGGLETVAPADAVRQVREAVLALRRRKSMVLDPADPNTRSAGSFFTNPVVPASAFADLEQRWQGIPSFPADGGVKVPAAWLVEQAGFPKGYRGGGGGGGGGSGISTRHALALVNLGGTSADLLALAEEVRAGVEQQFGIRLAYEPEVVSPSSPPPSRSR
jgi:UDP-N-acetylmuramate dehydrogenase